jgi:hypothetical protein
MTDITQLLKKYSKSYVPGEERSTEYDNMIKQKNILQDNIQLLHELNQELPETLTLNKWDLRIAETLVKRFHGHLKILHKQAKKEAIYLTFLFYLNKMENPLIQIEDYTIFRKYGLTTSIYSLIITRVCDTYIRERPIPITQTTNYDHDLLIRNGGI